MMENNLFISLRSETGIKIGGNTTKLMDGNIIFVVSEGDQTNELAIQQQKMIRKVAESLVGKVNYLIDINRCGKNAPGARSIWKSISEDQKTRKVATYGMNPVAKIIASFIIKSYNKNNLRFFTTKEEALKWIKE